MATKKNEKKAEVQPKKKLSADDLGRCFDWMDGGNNKDDDAPKENAPKENKPGAAPANEGREQIVTVKPAPAAPGVAPDAPAIEDAQAVEIVEEPKVDVGKAEESKITETPNAPAVVESAPAAPVEVIVPAPVPKHEEEPMRGVTVKMPASLHRRLTAVKYSLVGENISTLILKATEEFVLRKENEINKAKEE